MYHYRNLAEEKKNLDWEERRWAQEKKLLRRKQKLIDEQAEYKKKKRVSTSKLLILFLFINCSVIEIFTGWATVRMLDATINTSLIDFTPLIALIGAVVGEVLSYAIYSLKATKENTVGGLVYDKAMQNIDNEPSPPDEENSIG